MNSADLFVNLYLLEMLDLYKMVGPKVATKSSSACWGDGMQQLMFIYTSSLMQSIIIMSLLLYYKIMFTITVMRHVTSLQLDIYDNGWTDLSSNAFGIEIIWRDF